MTNLRLEITNIEAENRELRLALSGALQIIADIAASADTHPKGGDVQQAPLVSGAVPKADAQ